MTGGANFQQTGMPAGGVYGQPMMGGGMQMVHTSYISLMNNVIC